MDKDYLNHDTLTALRAIVTSLVAEVLDSKIEAETMKRLVIEKGVATEQEIDRIKARVYDEEMETIKKQLLNRINEAAETDIEIIKRLIS